MATTAEQDGASISEPDAAEDAALDLTEEQQLDEEISPADPASEDQPVLYVQVLDRQLRPRAGVSVVVRGAGIPEPRIVVTDDSGCFLLDDCGPGPYELAADGAIAQAHTLTQHDLEPDDAAYRILLSAG